MVSRWTGIVKALKKIGSAYKTREIRFTLPNKGNDCLIILLFQEKTTKFDAYIKQNASSLDNYKTSRGYSTLFAIFLKN